MYRIINKITIDKYKEIIRNNIKKHDNIKKKNIQVIYDMQYYKITKKSTVI